MDRRNFCNRIVQCLIRYGKLEEVEARKLVDESQICDEEEGPGEMLFHETSYYWAMHLLDGRADPKNYWFHNPDLWPPPADYYDWLKEWTADNEC
jgi:hypothetical protein